MAYRFAFCPPEMVLALSCYSFKEVQGYKMFMGGVILVGEGA
jgi:hypothetical protein